MRFDFVTEQGDGKKQRDRATKHLIRTRATQAAAETKRREGTIRPTDPLQLSSWAINQRARGKKREESRHIDEAAPSKAPLTILNSVNINADYHEPGDLQTPLLDPPRSLSPIICTENIPSLLATPVVQAHLVGSLLSRFNLTKDRVRIGKLLKLSDPEFLLQLSAKYGQSPALDSAIVCLAARIKELLHAPVQIENPRYLYGRALQTLQLSICNESAEHIENLWYTAPTLALFELLDASSHTPWMLHTKAAVELLKSVKACNIVTEPQKILLATQTPIMITEALASAGDCILDEPEWQVALQNIAVEGPPLYFRSDMIVQLFMFAAKIPNLFNEVTDAVRTSTTSVIPNLQGRLLDVRSACAIWNVRWQSMLNHVYDDPEIEFRRVFHRANSYVYAAMTERLLLALDTSQYIDLEMKALSHARQAAKVAELSSSVRLAHARDVSQSIISTSAQWQEHCMFSEDPMVSKDVFLDWARSLERPVEAAHT